MGQGFSSWLSNSETSDAASTAVDPILPASNSGMDEENIPVSGRTRQQARRRQQIVEENLEVQDQDHVPIQPNPEQPMENENHQANGPRAGANNPGAVALAQRRAIAARVELHRQAIEAQAEAQRRAAAAYAEARLIREAIIREQDSAYQESLRKDREKEIKKQEQAQQQKEEERTRKRKREEYETYLQELKQKKEATQAKLKSEPEKDHPDAIRILVKLPNGTRLERRFLKQDSLNHLYDFVFCHLETPESFELTRNFPKRTLPLPKGNNDTDSGISAGAEGDFEEVPSFAEFGITSNELLLVYSMQ